MKKHTTNYFNTFIEIAEDTKVSHSKIPVNKGNNKTIAEIQYEMIAKNPYHYSSDEVLFQVYAFKNDLPQSELKKAEELFFSKGQACFRASPLTKTHGFGIHFNENGKMALFGMETKEYHNFIENSDVKKIKAMRSSKK